MRLYRRYGAEADAPSDGLVSKFCATRLARSARSWIKAVFQFPPTIFTSASAFDADDRVIAGSVRCAPDDIPDLGRDRADGWPVVTYCVHGHEVSQNAAETLRRLGIDARYLAGGPSKACRRAGRSVPRHGNG